MGQKDGPEELRVLGPGKKQYDRALDIDKKHIQDTDSSRIETSCSKHGELMKNTGWVLWLPEALVRMYKISLLAPRMWSFSTMVRVTALTYTAYCVQGFSPCSKMPGSTSLLDPSDGAGEEGGGMRHV